MQRANTAASRKAKGSRLEKEIAGKYRHYMGFSKSSRMPLSGAISNLKGDILKMDERGRKVDTEYVDECKNAETIKLGEWLTQSISQCRITDNPVLHFSSNYRPTITVVEEPIWADWWENAVWEVCTIDKSSIQFWKEWDALRELAAASNKTPVMIFEKLDRAWAAVDTDVYFKMRSIS